MNPTQTQVPVVPAQRMDLKQVEPKAYQAMYALERYLSSSQLLPTHKELIKIRASQINGCAYCIALHTREAREAGESDKRMHALAAWHEAPYFTEEERAILALTEEVTRISDHQVSNQVYDQAARLFGEAYLAQLIMAIIAINGWNRIAITTRMTPE
jgi:AhpD family alkylhydroperoxidase